MKKKIILLAAIFACGTFGASKIYVEGAKDTVKVSIEEKRKNLPKVTEADFASIPLSEVQDKIKIPKDLHKKMKSVKGAPQINSEKRPGGEAIKAWYPTEKGELLIAQSVNPYHDVQSQIEDAKSWYPDAIDLEIGGNKAIYSEQQKTLHVVTQEGFYTVAGATENKETLIEAAKNIKAE